MPAIAVAQGGRFLRKIKRFLHGGRSHQGESLRLVEIKVLGGIAGNMARLMVEPLQKCTPCSEARRGYRLREADVGNAEIRSVGIAAQHERVVPGAEAAAELPRCNV